MAIARRLLNKVAIVTGSSSGLGRAIAIAYAHQGAFVACADLRPESRPHIHEETAINTDELIRKYGGSAIFVPTDVGDAKMMDHLIQSAVSEFGRLDMYVELCNSLFFSHLGLIAGGISMVNNAGISIEAHDPRPLHTTPDDTWDTTMRVNARSVFLGTKFAIAQMLKQEPHQPSGDRGWIINISSIMGSIATEGNRTLSRFLSTRFIWSFLLIFYTHLIIFLASYCASKGAVTSLTRQVAVEYAKHRIHCNSISPGCKFSSRGSMKYMTCCFSHAQDDGFIVDYANACLDTQTAIFAETTGSGMSSIDDLHRKHPFGGPGKPEDIAKFAVVLASDDAAWVSGANMFVDGGYTAR